MAVAVYDSVAAELFFFKNVAGPSTIQQVRNWCEAAAEALSCLHKDSLIHGIVCPDAFLIIDGMPVLGCLGYASALSEVLGETSSFFESNELRPFLAPEVLNGSVPDIRADVFGFAKTAASWHPSLAGTRWFQSATDPDPGMRFASVNKAREALAIALNELEAEERRLTLNKTFNSQTNPGISVEASKNPQAENGTSMPADDSDSKKKSDPVITDTPPTASSDQTAEAIARNKPNTATSVPKGAEPDPPNPEEQADIQTVEAEASTPPFPKIPPVMSLDNPISLGSKQILQMLLKALLIGALIAYCIFFALSWYHVAGFSTWAHTIAAESAGVVVLSGCVAAAWCAGLFHDFLCICAGAEPEVFRRISDPVIAAEVRGKYVLLGIPVCLTSISAFASMAYAIHTVTYDPKLADDWRVPIGVAIFWAAIVFNIDRIIVRDIQTKTANEAKGFWQKIGSALPILMRLGFALLLGTVISKPIEMWILSGRINQIVAEDRRIATRKAMDQALKLQQNSETGKQEAKDAEVVAQTVKDQLAKIKIDQENFKSATANLKSLIDPVTGKLMPGGTQIKKELSNIVNKEQVDESRYDNMIDKNNSNRNNIYLQKNIEKDSVKKSTNDSNEFVDDMNAMYKLENGILADGTQEEPEMGIVWTSRGVYILLMFVEVMPVIMKLTSKFKSAEDAYEAQIRIRQERETKKRQDIDDAMLLHEQAKIGLEKRLSLIVKHRLDQEDAQRTSAVAIRHVAEKANLEAANKDAAAKLLQIDTQHKAELDVVSNDATAKLQQMDAQHKAEANLAQSISERQLAELEEMRKALEFKARCQRVVEEEAAAYESELAKAANKQRIAEKYRAQSLRTSSSAKANPGSITPRSQKPKVKE